ncbi:MAG: rhomboid family intramembrane serine protease [Deltaproteobacteria bacterium]|nr:rhomboid family intramembrane serine protease [Candidatus Anaeroferrophillus wilburensis]MBN2888471.1 rhomboid family intramembrane serine protease [Deltaproteobacteria bacterium]
MIPLRDTIPSRTTPYVNYLLISLNIVLFGYELSWGGQISRLIAGFGVVPAHFFTAPIGPEIGLPVRYLPFLTHMFFHGGWLHLLGNMLYLWIFGDNVEDHLGHGGYLLFYLAAGVVAAMVHVVTNPHSQLPTIGASGAVAGVMGAYFLLYPRARIITLLPIFFFFTIVEVPAFLFLGFWFLLQLLEGVSAVGGRGAAYGGIAWWAHIGGFLFGQGYLLLFRQRRKNNRR